VDLKSKALPFIYFRYYAEVSSKLVELIPMIQYQNNLHKFLSAMETYLLCDTVTDLAGLGFQF